MHDIHLLIIKYYLKATTQSLSSYTIIPDYPVLPIVIVIHSYIKRDDTRTREKWRITGPRNVMIDLLHELNQVCPYGCLGKNVTTQLLTGKM